MRICASSTCTSFIWNNFSVCFTLQRILKNGSVLYLLLIILKELLITSKRVKFWHRYMTVSVNYVELGSISFLNSSCIYSLQVPVGLLGFCLPISEALSSILFAFMLLYLYQPTRLSFSTFNHNICNVYFCLGLCIFTGVLHCLVIYR